MMNDEEEIERLIREYLRANPTAGDTLEGIARWWILRQRITESIDLVRRALANLVAADLVVERRMLDGQIYYRLPGDNREPNQGTRDDA